MDFKKKYNQLFEATGTGMAIVEADGTLSLVSAKLAQTLETDVSKVVGTKFLKWIDEADYQTIKENHSRRLLGENISNRYDFRIKTAKGRARWVSVNISFDKQTRAAVVSIVEIDASKRMERELKEALASQNALFNAVSDLTDERKTLEKRLDNLSNSDPLTGLYNRKELNTKISKEIYKITRNPNPLSVAFFNIDNFKRVNEIFGHDIGDIVIEHLAKLLKASIRETDDAFRYAGEEFVVVMENTSLLEAEKFSERFRALVEKSPLEISANKKIRVTISVGASHLTADMKSLGALIKVADLRMRAAKRMGRNRVVSSDFIDLLS